MKKKVFTVLAVLLFMSSTGFSAEAAGGDCMDDVHMFIVMADNSGMFSDEQMAI